MVDIEVIDVKNINFDKLNHIFYYNNGSGNPQRLPSVSEIIDSSRFYKDIPKDILEKSMEYGAYLHQDVKYFLETNEIWSDRIKKFKEIFDLTKKKNGNLIGCEKIVSAKVNGVHYAGIYDIMLESAIIEVKTAIANLKNHLHYAVQLVAYSMASGRFNDIKDYYVFYYDKKTESWKIKSYTELEIYNAIDCFINGYIKKYYSNMIIENYYSEKKTNLFKGVFYAK
jgi:hypothetical protein